MLLFLSRSFAKVWMVFAIKERKRKSNGTSSTLHECRVFAAARFSFLQGNTTFIKVPLLDGFVILLEPTVKSLWQIRFSFSALPKLLFFREIPMSKSIFKEMFTTCTGILAFYLSVSVRSYYLKISNHCICGPRKWRTRVVRKEICARPIARIWLWLWLQLRGII